MAAFNKFQDFVEQLGKGVHHLHTAGDTIECYLSDEQPLVGDTIKTDIAEISSENGYPGGIADIDNDYTETTGTGTMTGTDLVFAASGGGGFGTLQFVVMFNQTATSPADALIGWWDYGSSIQILDGETFTVDFGASILTIGP